MLENAHFFLHHKLQMHDDFMKKTLSLVVMKLLFRKFRTIFVNSQILFKWYSYLSNYM